MGDDVRILKAMRVAAIVDLTSEVAGVQFPTRDDDIEQMKMPLGEWYANLDSIFGFIERHLKEGLSSLVHDGPGCEGAGAIAIAYIVSTEGIAFIEAFQRVVAARP